MTNELIQSELDKAPFVPFRIHRVSGTTVDVMTARGAYAMGNAVMVFHPMRNRRHDAGYDLIPLYNIERLEQLEES